MQYALIKGGTVANTVEVEDSNEGLAFLEAMAQEFDHVEALDTPHEQGLGVGIGWGWDGSFVAPPAPELPEPPAPSVPASVTKRQACLALHAIGKLAAVDGAIAGLPEPQRTTAQIEWTYAGDIDRHSAMTLTLAALLSLDDAHVDALFKAAAAL